MWLLFDPNDYGWLTESLLQQGLSTLGIASTEMERRLFLRRWGRKGGVRMGMQEFVTMLTPIGVKEGHRIKYLDRSINYGSKRGFDFFSADNMLVIGEVFRVLLAAERAIEEIRNTLHQSSLFLESIFNSIDVYSRGVINSIDLENLLQA